MQYNLHFYVKEFLYLEKDDKVVKNFRFCLANNCTGNTTSSFNDLNYWQVL